MASHSADVKDEIHEVVKQIASALNADQRDTAEIKSYNKLVVYTGKYGPYAFEVVVRFPMEPRELELHRESKKRKAAIAAKRAQMPAPLSKE
jgi:hypothetical protein